MKYVFVVNPCAGQGGSQALIREAVAALPEKDDCEVYLTKGVGDAIQYVRARCGQSPDESIRFIACGGDGTINEVFNGAVGCKNASVTCYPCGSGNDFVKCFGGKERFSNVAALLHAPEQKLDLMKIGERYCVNICNFGFDTTVAITMNQVRNRKLLGGKNAYTTGVVKALLTAMKSKCTVTVDGEPLNPKGIMLLCTVANGQYVGGAFRCAPKASTSDGLLDACLVTPISRLRFVKLLGPYTKGEHLDSPDFADIITYRRGKTAVVDAQEGFAYFLDGEIIYSSHFTIEMVEGALRLAVPEQPEA